MKKYTALTISLLTGFVLASLVIFIYYLQKPKEAEKTSASVSGGNGEIIFTPAGGSVDVDVAIPVDIKFRTGSAGNLSQISSISLRLTMPYPSGSTFEITDQNGSPTDSISPDASLLGTGKWAFPVARVERAQGQATIELAALYIDPSPDGFASPDFVNLARFYVKGSEPSEVLFSVDEVESRMLTKATPPVDVLAPPQSFTFNVTRELTEAEVCEQGGGTWRELPTACVDLCSQYGSVTCQRIPTFGCDCGVTQCWDGQRCLVNPTQSASPTATASPTPTGTLVSTASPTPPETTGGVDLNPIDDSFVRADNPSSNYGSISTLQVDGDPQKIAYLKFDLGAINRDGITTATLKVRVSTDQFSGSASIQELWVVYENDWREETITFNNRLSLSAAVNSSISGTALGQWKEINVTNTVKNSENNLVTFAIVSSGSDGLDLFSKESGSAPILTVLSTQATATATATASPTPTATPQKSTLNYRLKFQGRTFVSAPPLLVNFDFRQSGFVKHAFSALTGSDSDSAALAGIDSGNYDIYVKGPFHLTRRFQGENLVPGANTRDWTAYELRAGDFDADNKLDITDIGDFLRVYTVLSSPVNSGNSQYDVNGDSRISISDIAVVLSNYTDLEVLGD